METVSRRGALRAAGAAATVGALGYAAARPDAAFAVSAGDIVVSVIDHGARGDGTTDDSRAVQDAIAAVAATGGTVFFPVGTYRIDSQLAIPNDGGRIPRQRPIKLLGQGCHFSGRGTDIYGGSVLDLRSTTGPAKIDTRGLGLLEITGLTLHCTTSSSTPVIQTTNTTLHVYRCAFETTKRGTRCDVDAIVLGGTQPQAGNAATDGFQGYGSVIRENYFQGIRRAVYGRTWCNGNVIDSNTVWSTAGTDLADGGCIELNGNPAAVTPNQHAVGNVISNNLIEITNYPYAIKLDNAAENTIAHNNIYDKTSVSQAAVRLERDAVYNMVIDGFVPGILTPLSMAEPGTTTYICPHQAVPNKFYALEARTTLRFGADGDAELRWIGPHVVGMPSTDCFKTGRGTTGSRPSASDVGRGAQWYDNTLKLPIWSDGTNWTDAAGNVV